MISKANKIIQEAFKHKVDKGGEPYVYHLNRVARRFEGTNNIVISLLHDLLEDCPEWSEQKLRLEFPEKIVDAVVCLTKIKGESYLDYLNRVKSNEMALRVKISDLEDNMDIKRLNILTDKDCERLKKYHKAWIELTHFV
jgi:(p)ppGpp synthase/HD superfamily hydrolase